MDTDCSDVKDCYHRCFICGTNDITFIKSTPTMLIYECWSCLVIVTQEIDPQDLFFADLAPAEHPS